VLQRGLAFSQVISMLKALRVVTELWGCRVAMFDVLVLAVDAKRQRTFGLWQRNKQACCCKPGLASAGVLAQKKALESSSGAIL